jgi:hypothetical protein
VTGNNNKPKLNKDKITESDRTIINTLTYQEINQLINNLTSQTKTSKLQRQEIIEKVGIYSKKIQIENQTNQQPSKTNHKTKIGKYTLNAKEEISHQPNLEIIRTKKQDQNNIH